MYVIKSVIVCVVVSFGCSYTFAFGCCCGMDLSASRFRVTTSLISICPFWVTIFWMLSAASRNFISFNSSVVYILIAIYFFNQQN
ncbi:hypothetical protein RchiOBHm_Chr2g0157661 [Rosa chinensis]|uniref:Uncharacterized protein n=1 Tax=Rosa chinensis TaxID=74649 RepID=A0A2P6S1S8_ROSCH|nr:hypothetical protein RchiOBHm_Chr2g0157661 [Rosa chinensis]